MVMWTDALLHVMYCTLEDGRDSGFNRKWALCSCESIGNTKLTHSVRANEVGAHNGFAHIAAC